MTLIDSQGKKKLSQLFIFWIVIKIIDFAFRLTIASNIDSALVYNNIIGILFLFVLFYLLIKGKNWARVFTIIICSAAIILTTVLFIIGDERSMSSWFETYKYITVPILMGCNLVCAYLLLFDKSVKEFFLTNRVDIKKNT